MTIIAVSIFSINEQVFLSFKLINNLTSKIESSQEMPVINYSSGFMFRQISNSNIDVPCSVYVGDANSSAKIYNSSIICNKILWNAKNILIESISPGYCLLASKENIESNIGEYPNFDIRVDNNSSLKVSLPNETEFFRFRPYLYSLYDDSNEDCIKFMHVLKKITGCLRKHKKDTPARDREFIDNVIIGENLFKKNVLSFLINLGIIFIDNDESHLYKLNIEKLDIIGLNWSLLNISDINQMNKAFDFYNKWKKSNI